MLLGFLVLVALASARSIVGAQRDLHLWTKFKHDHDKVYGAAEEQARFHVFQDNIKKIAQLNEEHNPLTVFAINKFADLTAEEFKVRYFNKPMPRALETVEAPKSSGVKIPTTWDWRDHGAVTPILNQGQCGSSPYFSAVVGLEGAWAIAGHPLVPLSVQQILDCSSAQGNAGCNGGLMTNSYDYILKAGGLESAKDYPYTGGEQGPCKFDPKKITARMTGYKNLPQGNEQALTEALTISPIAAAVDAEPFQFYSSGVFNSSQCSNTEIDHGIGIVGYSVTPQGVPYYILKNSWGTSWGMQGYIWVIRNQNDMCGVASTCSYPICPK